MIVAIVLGAGLSKRMGKTKQVLDVDGSPMLQRVLEMLRRTKVERTVVVLGADAELVKKKVKFQKELVVYNERYSLGMSESLKVGLRSAGNRAEAAIVMMSDQPLVTSSTVDKIIDAYRLTGPLAVVPTFGGTRGNPVLLDRKLFAAVKGIKGDVGAKSVLKENKRRVLELEVQDRGVVSDVDTPEDYRNLTSTAGSHRATPGRWSHRT